MYKTSRREINVRISLIGELSFSQCFFKSADTLKSPYRLLTKVSIFYFLQTFLAIGLLTVNIPWPNSMSARHYNFGGGIAFMVTLILLLILTYKASLRKSSLFRKIEIFIFIILTTLFVFGAYEMSGTWYWNYYDFLNRNNSTPDTAPYSNYHLRTLFGSLVAMVRK